MQIEMNGYRLGEKIRCKKDGKIYRIWNWKYKDRYSNEIIGVILDFIFYMVLVKFEEIEKVN